MKIYVKSSEAISEILPVSYGTTDWDNNNINDYFTQEDIDNFTNSIKDCIMSVVTPEQCKQLGLRLYVGFIVFGERGGWPDSFLPAQLSATISSIVVKPKHYSFGRGGSNNCPKIYWNDKTPLNLSAFRQKVAKYVADISKDAKKLRTLNTSYDEIDTEILDAAHTFSYWIIKENISNRDELAARTVDNKRSWLYNSDKYRNQLDSLFDYIEENNYTLKDIKKLCKDADFLSRRKQS